VSRYASEPWRSNERSERHKLPVRRLQLPGTRGAFSNVTRARRGELREVLRPAFPRYVMVPFGLCWQVLRDVWRVLGIVHFGEEVACIRAREIDCLIERCGGGNVLPPEPIIEPYARGARVCVGGTGLLSGHEAVFHGVTEDGRLRVLFNMMGQTVPIDVDGRDVFVSKRGRKRGRRRGHRKQSEGTAAVA
jgi:transcription antitermination factor NusG